MRNALKPSEAKMSQPKDQRTQKRLGWKPIRAYLNHAEAREKLPAYTESASRPPCVSSRLFFDSRLFWRL
jgi:hypothetical protein